jgi:hypothetical protein
MRNCRKKNLNSFIRYSCQKYTIWGHLGAEFSDVLMVLRSGSTPLMFTTVSVLHGIVISFLLAVMVAVLIRKKQVLSVIH